MPTPIIDSWEAAHEYIVTQLFEHLNDTIVTGWAVTPNGAGNPYSADGYYMPPCEAFYYSGAPTPSELEVPNNEVACFIGPTLDTTYPGATFTTGMNRMGHEVDMPFGVSLLITDTPHEPINAPHGSGRPLTPDEILTRRALKYLGALKHCIFERVAENDAALFTQSFSDYIRVSPTVTTSVGGEAGQLGVAIAFVEFTVRQTQTLPCHSP